MLLSCTPALLPFPTLKHFLNIGLQSEPHERLLGGRIRHGLLPELSRPL